MHMKLCPEVTILVLAFRRLGKECDTAEEHWIWSQGVVSSPGLALTLNNHFASLLGLKFLMHEMGNNNIGLLG